jgi:hypothetical protein
MLEQRVLLVRPRAVSALRIIVDGDSGKPLGFARWEEEVPRPWWRPFRVSVLAVHEHEDEPLLFTIRRAWSLLPRHEVRDAEGHPVGSLLGRLVHDRFGRPLAALENNNGSSVFRTSEHRTLAELTATVDGLRVFFSADIAGEPLVKMLLLAAALDIHDSERSSPRNPARPSLPSGTI